MKKIKLTRGKYAIVDNDDYPILSQHSWHCLKNNYAATRLGKTHNYKHVLMHRMILNVPKRMLTHHVNGNKLDNRKANLRICNDSQNTATRARIKRTNGIISKFKGVTYDHTGKRRKRWRAYIRKEGIPIRKRFGSEMEAALFYNKMAKELHGEFAYQNKIP